VVSAGDLHQLDARCAVELMRYEIVEQCDLRSFLDRQEQWSGWVIAHRLPELPGTEIDVDQAVPVSYGIGPTTATVLHIRYVDEDDDEDEGWPVAGAAAHRGGLPCL
jgi:hypothetical protein